MLFWILLAISAAGFGYAAYKDLRTTEFPDWLPYAIIVSAVGARAAFAYILSDWSIITSSLVIGGLFLGAGLALYYTKQWGDGDGWLLGALGFTYPGTAGMQEAVVFMMPLPLILLFNFFIIAFLYLVAYSVVLGMRNRAAVKTFFRDLRKDMRSIELITIGFTAGCVGMAAYLYFGRMVPVTFIATLFIFPPLLLALLTFMRYGRFVESTLFRKHVSVKDLKVGDVPVNSKWRVMNERELTKLKRKGGKIWIKEGVRFAPVFIITVIVTLFYGSLFSLLI